MKRRSFVLANTREADRSLLLRTIRREREHVTDLQDRESLSRWEREVAGSGSNVLQLFDDPDQRSAVERIFEHYRTAMGRPRAQLDGKRARLIEKRRREYDEATLLLAIDGCARSAWHQGDNPDGRKYNALDLILRDAEHIEAFCEIAERGTAPRPTLRPSFGATGREAQTRAELDAFKRGPGK